MKIRLIISVILLGLLTSCNKFLDVTPKGMVIPQTVEDYNQMLNMTGGSISNVTYMSPELYMPKSLITSSGASEIAAYYWSEYQYLENVNDGTWNGLYARIYACNEIIEKIDKAETVTMNEMLRKNVKGQAYAERARCYFALVNMYAKHYSQTTVNDLGVPLILSNDILQKSSRAKISEVYNQIIRDLSVAKVLVPKTVKENEKAKATEQAVYAFLAKVYLFENKIDSSLIAINKAFETSVNFHRYNEYIRTTISDLFDKSSLPTESNKINETLWNGGVFSNFWAYTAYYSDDLLTIFDKDNDLRFYFFASNVDRTNRPLPSYRYVNRITRTHAASVAEMYLIRAECYARTGATTLAMNDLNVLRYNRFREGSNYQLTASTKEEAINQVKKERLRELAFTGQNWFDLKRYQAYGEVVPTFTRISGDSTITLAPGSNRYVCSIPRFVIGKNPNIEQNPR